jgi:hypothetical protein
MAGMPEAVQRDCGLGSTTIPQKAVRAFRNRSIQGGNVVLTGLPTGTHFFTIKAQDAGGKKAFDHLVIDVQ